MAVTALLAIAAVGAAETPAVWDAATALPTPDDAVCAAVDAVPEVNPRDKGEFDGDIIFNRSKFEGDENGASEGLPLGRGAVGMGFRSRSLLVGENGSPVSEGAGEDWVFPSAPRGPLFAAVACGAGAGAGRP